jgi:hypothetical protein
MFPLYEEIRQLEHLANTAEPKIPRRQDENQPSNTILSQLVHHLYAVLSSTYSWMLTHLLCFKMTFSERSIDIPFLPVGNFSDTSKFSCNVF